MADLSAGSDAQVGDAAPIRVLIVDDDPLVRSGLVMMLDGAGSLSVVGEAGDGAEAVDAVVRTRPDVVLMDLRMPRVNGVAATRALLARPEPPAVIVLTTFDSDENVMAALRVGADGFLVKDTEPAQIVRAVERVHAGEPILSPDITRRLVHQAVDLAESRARARSALAGMTPREREVALAVARGESNAQIAREQHIGMSTVKTHVSSLRTKLGLVNRTQLAVLAHEAGLL
ncbi:response regulator [Agilicoccus flavus]|uniref:response regulator n=1 Tax=Agilicoccus flavus TaxID=2775968 RepID=UPI001CF65B9F|nr:response regulator transcription factor [Agilicoccus flavus]